MVESAAMTWSDSWRWNCPLAADQGGDEDEDEAVRVKVPALALDLALVPATVHPSATRRASART